jgi:hypothetical protein
LASPHLFVVLMAIGFEVPFARSADLFDASEDDRHSSANFVADLLSVCNCWLKRKGLVQVGGDLGSGLLARSLAWEISVYELTSSNY